MQLRLSAYSVIVDDQGRLLMSRWADGRKRLWTLPGGGVNLGEDPEAAARREAWEETGYRIEVIEPLEVHSRIVPQVKRLDAGAEGDLQQIRLVYRSRVVGGNLKFEQHGTSDRAAWMRLTELPEQRMNIVNIGLAAAGLVVQEQSA